MKYQPDVSVKNLYTYKASLKDFNAAVAFCRQSSISVDYPQTAGKSKFHRFLLVVPTKDTDVLVFLPLRSLPQ